MNINSNIKEKRAEKNITQEQLAKAVGVARQTIVAIEKGNYIPSLLLAMQLGDFFDLPVEKLFYTKK